MSVIRFERPVMQVLEIGVSAAGAQKKKIKALIGLFIAIALWSAPALAQERNEVGLQIGGIVTPSQGLTQGGQPHRTWRNNTSYSGFTIQFQLDARG